MNLDDLPEPFGVLRNVDGVQTAVMRLERGEVSGPLGNEPAQSTQVVLLVEGELEAQIGDEHFHMQPGETVIVPKGVAHQFVGASDDSAVTFNTYVPPAH